MHHDPLATADRVPFWTRILYGFGSISEGVKNTAFNTFLLFYYNQVLGVSGTLAGAAIFIALCVDAITDPLVGSISDNTHSRLGRRHPYMYASALPMAVSFFLIFNPPALDETGLFVWLCAFAVGVRASMTLYSIPSNTMVAELTPSYDERTTLVSFRVLFGWAGGLTASLLGYVYFFAPSDAFEDGRLDPSAYAAFGGVSAVMIFLAIMICSVGTHHVIPLLKPPPEKTPFTLKRFLGEMGDALTNRSYRMLVVASLFSSVAGGFNDVVGLYMNTYFWEFSTQQITIFVLGLGLAVVIAVSFTRTFSARLDKRRGALALATFAILFGPLPVFLRLLELMPPNGSQLLFYLIFCHGIIIVTPIVAIGILLSSMIADTVDESELATGRRQEGIFVSAIAFTSKATSGIGTLLAGIALDLIDFPQQAAAGSVPPDKVFQLGFAVGPGMFVLFLLTLIFLSRYRITREGHAAVLAELDRRRQAAPSPGTGSR